MNRADFWTGIFMVTAGVALLVGGIAKAHGNELRTVRLEPGASRVLSTPQSLTHIVVADPAIADIRKLSAQDVLVTAKNAGVTTLRLQSGPTSVQGYRIVVDPGQEFDSQVQADIRIVEVSRSALMESGISLAKNTRDTTISVTSPGTLGGIRTIPQTGDTFTRTTPDSSFSHTDKWNEFELQGNVPIGQAFNLVAGSAEKGLLGIMSLLESNGFAYTLAEPSLTVMNGHTARFHAGGEVPLVSSNANGTTVTYHEYGIRLALTPTVIDPQRIVLQVDPEVSEIDPSASSTYPAFRVRRTETTVQLADGESFVISGLISRTNTAAVDKVPFLGDLPILGAFFKSTHFERSDKELIMIVTPRLVRAIAAGSPTPPLPGAAYDRYRPGFSEVLFLEGGRFNQLNSSARNGE